MIGGRLHEKLKAPFKVSTTLRTALFAASIGVMIFKLFGIDAEILIDHAWGVETVTMPDIKNYQAEGHSVSTGQVLPRAYSFEEGFLVFREMADLLCSDLVAKGVTTDCMTWWVSFDPKTLDNLSLPASELEEDFYHKIQPKGTHDTVRLRSRTDSKKAIMEPLCLSFQKKVDPRFLIRRLGICACNTEQDSGCRQLDMFTTPEALDRERDVEKTILAVRRRYGMNSLVRGMNLEKSGTTIERNQQIGGHRAGTSPLPTVSSAPEKPAHPPIVTVSTDSSTKNSP